MKIDKAELANIKEAATGILLAIGRIEAVHNRDDWPGARNVVLFSLGEVSGRAHKINHHLGRIVEPVLATRPGAG